MLHTVTCLSHGCGHLCPIGIDLSNVPGVVIFGFCIVSCFPHCAGQGRPGRLHRRALQPLRLIQPQDFRALARDGPGVRAKRVLN